MRDISGFLLRNGIMFAIERNGTSPSPEKGLLNREQSTQKRYIGFKPGTIIEIGDWLINPSGDRYFVYDKENVTHAGDPYQLKCYVQSEAEYNNQQSNNPNLVFNIGSATGSVIGTQSVVNFNYTNTISELRSQVESSDSPDKEDLRKAIELFEMVINNQLPAQKGIFSKYADVLKRNAWFATPMMSALFGWLTSQIP